MAGVHRRIPRLTIPLWVGAPSIALLGVGGFLIQFFVQGAWGVIPAHLNELSPNDVRGTFPGFTYQLGNLISAGSAQLEAAYAATLRTASGQPDYAKALSSIGPERRGVRFAETAPAPVGG